MSVAGRQAGQLAVVETCSGVPRQEEMRILTKAGGSVCVWHTVIRSGLRLYMNRSDGARHTTQSLCVGTDVAKLMPFTSAILQASHIRCQCGAIHKALIFLGNHFEYIHGRN